MPVYPGASIEQQRHHHRRVISRPRPPVDPIGRVERVQVHLADGVDDKPREVALRKPLTDIGRHQKRLLAITRDKALSHAPNRLSIGITILTNRPSSATHPTTSSGPS